jgi:GxxExxY protein
MMLESGPSGTLIFMKKPLLHEELSRSIIAAFFETYNDLGYGFSEHICVTAIEKEIERRGHVVARELAVPVWVKNEVVGNQRLDMLVDDKIILEVKSALVLPKAADQQLASYLHGTEFEVGLILHFGEEAKFYRRVLLNEHKKHIRPLSAPNPPQSALRKPSTRGNADD